MMLSYGRAMMTGAEVYLLDEPSSGLAPSLIDQVFEMTRRLVASGAQVILIEQNVREASDRRLCLHSGAGTAPVRGDSGRPN